VLSTQAAAGLGNITVTGTVNATGAGVQGLTLVAGTGSIDVQGVVGGVTALSTLTMSSAGVARFGGNVTTVGAQVVTAGTIQTNGTHLTTNTGISFTGNVVLQSGTVLSTQAAAGVGNITVTGTVNAAGAGVQGLTLAAGTGNVDLQGVMGAATALSALTVTSAGSVVLNGLGSGSQDGVNGAATVTSSGAIVLQGAHYKTGNSQTWSAAAQGLRFLTTGSGDWSAGAGTISLPATDLYIDVPGVTVNMGSDFSGRRFIFFRGSINVNGKVITTTSDFVVFGSAYDANDADMNATNPDNNFFEYPGKAAFLFDPFPAPGPYGYTAQFSDGAIFDLSGATINVGSNFYVNGTDMLGGVVAPAANWTLSLPDNAGSTPPWGPGTYAKAFHMSVDYSVAGLGWVSAASPVAGPPAETNNAVIEATPGTDVSWDFGRPQIVSVETVKDNVVRVTFNKPIENSANEISQVVAAAAVTYTNSANLAVPGGSAGLVFSDTWLDPLCTQSTNGAGDQTTFYIRTIIPAGTWNTDIVGSTDPGYAAIVSRAASTDRTGVNRLNVPNLFFLKAAFYDEHKNPARNYGYNAVPDFSSTTDNAGAVLYKIEIGRTIHNALVASGLDGHNFFVLHWSEPVDLGAHLNPINTSLGPANFVRSDIDFSGQAVHGGDMIAAGPNTRLVGFFDYNDPAGKGPMTRGSRDGNQTANAMYRDDLYDLVVYLSGFSTFLGTLPQEDQYLWPGWHKNVPDPAAATAITVLPNAEISDGSPAKNAVDAAVAPPASFTPIAAGPTTLAAWDVDPPEFSIYSAGSPNFMEIVTLASIVTGRINSLQFHLQDNTAEVAGWDPIANPGLHPDPRANHGMRDSTWSYPGAIKAFSIQEVDKAPPNPPYAYNQSLTTNVSNVIFTPNAGDNGNIVDDSYFSLNVDDASDPWTLLSRLVVSYDETQVYLTDLAGNILASTSAPLHVIERSPPQITLTLASAESTKVYVKFSKPVYGSVNGVASRTQRIQKNLFSISGTSTIADLTITKLESDGVGADEAFFTLSQSLTPNQAYSDRIHPAGPTMVYDVVGTPMDSSRLHRITDVGIGLATPVWASDGIHGNTTAGSTQGALTVFDGSGFLLPTTITLQAAIQGDLSTNLPLGLSYDMNPPAASVVNGFWLPTVIPGLLPVPDGEARGLLPVLTQGNLRTFSIPGNDPEVKAGAKLDFVLKLGDLYCAQITDPNDPTTLVPWSFTLKDIVTQRAGVTILNNVINPTLNEQTFIRYRLETAGTATIQVFALDGSLVKVLFRGRQGVGDYTYAWDGKNSSGEVVARGIYFIRVVAPGIDEFRKVLVVK
jgi:hypothetical protein